LAAAPLALAETTKQWRQSLFEDFEEGRAEKVSLRSDGTLLLAPSFHEIYDAPSSYLWALAADSKGNLYTAGGPDAKVFRIGADGSKSTFFETAAVEIHALAIDAADNVYAATSPDAKIYRIEPSGANRLFFDPGESYIWDMAFDSKGNLLVATGDGGKVYHVTPSGEGKLFFDTEETHVR
jgi:sugar lactone lactonase YvrE